MFTILACILVTSVCNPPAGSPESSTSGSPDLSRGVNLSHWFWYPSNPDKSAIQRYITSHDVRLLADAGITHVRVPIEPSRLWDVTSHTFNEATITQYLDGLSIFTSEGIAVIVDPHPNTTPWADPNAEDFEAQYPRFWSALAQRLAPTDPRYYVLEVMNEPHDLKDPARWSNLQEKIIASMRAAAPAHTIVATGDEWSSIAGLTRLTLSTALKNDRNIVYSFHFYEPHTFTHQGATWGAPNWKHLRDVPFPSTPERIENSLAATIHPDGKREVQWYADQRWDSAKVTSMIEEASAWALAQGAPITLYCGEFGVHAPPTRRQDRATWIHHVRGTLEAKKIGWAMWDYSGSFALAAGKPGARTLDVNITKALGLKLPLPFAQPGIPTAEKDRPQMAPPLRPLEPAP